MYVGRCKPLIQYTVYFFKKVDTLLFGKVRIGAYGTRLVKILGQENCFSSFEMQPVDSPGVLLVGLIAVRRAAR